MGQEILASTLIEPEERLPAVTVSGQGDNGVGASDAASQGTVTARDLGVRPLQRPGDLLESVPGMVVTQHSGDGKANQYFLRGFNLDHGTDFATTVAGIPINLPTHAHGHGYTDLNFLIPELVERIDYRKGPYFAANGDFSSVGSASFVLRSRLDRDLAQVSLGPWGYQRMLGAASPAMGSDRRLLLAGEAQYDDGPWDTPQQLRRFNGLLRHGAGTVADGWDMTLIGNRAQWRGTDQVPVRALDQGRIGRFGSLDPTDGGQTERQAASLQWRRALPDGRLQVTGWAQRYRLDLYSNFTYALRNPAAGDQFLQRDERTAAGAQMSRLWFGQLAGYAATSEIGMQWRHDRIRVGLFDSASRGVLATTRDDRVSQASASVYAEQGITWTGWLRSVAGLRADRFNWSIAADRPENSGASAATLISPKASMILGPWERTELFLNWGRGFHSNDGRSTVLRVDPSTGAPASRVTGMARTVGYEIGVRTDLLPSLQGSLAIWRLALASELLFLGDAGTTEPSRPSQRQGVEWSTRWTPRSWLVVNADLAWSDARFTDSNPSGSQVPGAVSRVASLSMALRELGPWTAALQWRHLGARPLTEDGRVMAAPVTRVDGRFSWRLDRTLTLAAEVFNLLDRRADDIAYFYRSRMPGEAGAVDDIHVHPATPRMLRLTARFSL